MSPHTGMTVSIAGLITYAVLAILMLTMGDHRRAGLFLIGCLIWMVCLGIFAAQI